MFHFVGIVKRLGRGLKVTHFDPLAGLVVHERLRPGGSELSFCFAIDFEIEYVVCDEADHDVQVVDSVATEHALVVNIAKFGELLVQERDKVRHALRRRDSLSIRYRRLGRVLFSKWERALLLHR